MGRSKEERRLKLKRLEKLEKAVELLLATLPRVGNGNPEIYTSKLSPELRKVIRAHDQCCWNNILEDLDDEDK